MVTSPAHIYDEDGNLVERAVATDAPRKPVEVDAVTGRPNDEAEENSTFASRAKAAKRVATAEDKAVKKASKK